MAKGTYRKKRNKVLAELEERDPIYAQQLRDMRTNEPQAFRKAMIKVDIALAAELGRPLTLSMRPKRFGGDEDPVLVRRVLALRKEQLARERTLELGPSQWERTLEREQRAEEMRRPRTSEEEAQAEEDGPAGGGSFMDQARGRTGLPQGGLHMQHPTPPLAPEALRSAHDDIKRAQDRTPQGVADGGYSFGEKERLKEPPVRARQGGRDHGDVPASAPVQRPAATRSAVAKSAKAAGPDLSMLKGAVGAVKKALATGEYDPWLAELLAAEKAGKARKGALAAIQGRM